MGSRKLWLEIFDGGHGSWLYARNYPVGSRKFHFIEVLDMDYHCGRDNEGHATYAGTLSEVDLDTADVEGAKECCGWEPPGGVTDLHLAEMCHSYGCKAPLANENGNNLRNIIRALKRESRELEEPDAYEDAMNRPVNALGSTAREFARGDFDSALVRGIQADDTRAKLCAKIAGKVIACPPRPADWMPWMMGYMEGIAGHENTATKDYAKEYTDGYTHGKRVYEGVGEPCPWIRAHRHPDGPVIARVQAGGDRQTDEQAGED